MAFTASDLCKIFLAIFLPPLGVFLERGCNADFFINILLTILGYIPVSSISLLKQTWLLTTSGHHPRSVHHLQVLNEGASRNPHLSQTVLTEYQMGTAHPRYPLI